MAAGAHGHGGFGVRGSCARWGRALVGTSATARAIHNYPRTLPSAADGHNCQHCRLNVKP